MSTVLVTVPACFNENQVMVTNRAAELAGLKITRTLNEPVSAL
ncbi:MAG: Hsp70 family protein [Aeromonas sp.]